MVIVGQRAYSGPHITMRPAYPSDGEALARMAAQAGFDVEPSEAVRRLQALPATDCVFVATTVSGVIGCVDLSVVRGLFEPPFVHVATIVVMLGWRGIGIGHRLMDHAEAWACTQRMAHIDVRQDIVTKEAEGFFRTIGYEETPVTGVLTKKLR